MMEGGAMYRLLVFARVWVLAVLAALLAIGDAAGSHPDILRNYRFIPSRSVLEVTGGFAGIDETSHVRGTFGLVTGYEDGVSCAAIGCPPPPSHVPFAKFVDVDARLVSKGPFTNGWDLDDTLNLSGLNGTFHPAAPNRLFFRGVDGQGQPFKLNAVQHGRLLHMVGENDPGCCDFFEYKFNALAYLTPRGDFNFDGVVDAGDYVLWRKTAGRSGTGLEADGNEDGVVNADDYELWRTQFGEAVDFSQFAGADLHASAVPEPTTIAPALAGMAYLLLRRRN
jgi:hypothetical protein